MDKNQITLLLKHMNQWNVELLADGYYVGRKFYNSHTETRCYFHQYTRRRLTMYVHFSVGALTLYDGKRLLKKYEV